MEGEDIADNRLGFWALHLPLQAGLQRGLVHREGGLVRIIPAARLLQASYSSWDEYAADYLLGRYFWAPDETAEMEHIRYIIGLLESPTGLWSAIPWNESLGEGPVMRDVYASRVLRKYNDPDGNRASDSYVPEEGEMRMRWATGCD